MYSDKEERRDIITKAQIGQKLKKNAAETIPGLIFVFFLIGSLPALFLLFDVVIISIISLLMLVVWFTVIAYYIVMSIITIVDVKKGRFTVSEDRLIGYYNRYDRRYSDRFKPPKRKISLYHKWNKTDCVYYFESGKEYAFEIPKYDNGTRLGYTIAHSNEGDIFYLVTLDRFPTNILLAYNGDIFKYEDNN